MNTSTNAAILAIIEDYTSARAHIETLIANMESNKSILSRALFACASYHSRAADNKPRARLYSERAKQFAWDEIISHLAATGTAEGGILSLSNQYTYTSGTYYQYDIKAAVLSPFSLQDAYNGDIKYYAGRMAPLAEITLENVEKLIDLMAASDVNDGHHVWSFLYKCGASHKADATAFKKRMTWRATASGYEWQAGIANLYRIFCQRTGRPFSWDAVYTELRNNRALVSNGDVFDAFGDMMTLEKHANGNSTLIFTPEALAVLNAIELVDYKTACEYFTTKANSIV